MLSCMCVCRVCVLSGSPVLQVSTWIVACSVSRNRSQYSVLFSLLLAAWRDESSMHVNSLVRLDSSSQGLGWAERCEVTLSDS